ncbi:MAG: hypothetical protein NDI60_01660 [Elusimicrobiales bacterium]|nr:hypothetical protein [Elusimicrobiales bacterium]
MTSTEIWEVSRAVILSLGGAGLILFSLSSLLSKIWADRILYRERHALDKELSNLQQKSSELMARLQAVIDRAQHVSRVTFDREFDTYKEAWDRVVDLRAAVLSLRPIMDYVDPKQSEDDRKRERLKRYYDSLAPFWNSYEKNRPFLPEQIYHEFSNLADITRKEEAYYRFDSPKEDVRKYWEDSLKHRDEIIGSCDKISNLIRARLLELSSIQQK